MIHIEIYTIGKAKDPWLKEALTEYEKRLKREAVVTWHLYKTDRELETALSEGKNCFVLDERGKGYTSQTFSTLLSKQLTIAGNKLRFCIGGPDGFSPEFRKKAAHLIKLSDMTLTHQMARLLLLEQIYRAFAIEKGLPYHRA